MRYKSINKALDNWLSELKYGREYETLRCIRVNINRLIQYFDDDLSLITFETYVIGLNGPQISGRPTVHKTHKTAKRLIKRLNLTCQKYQILGLSYQWKRLKLIPGKRLGESLNGVIIKIAIHGVQGVPPFF